MLLAGDLGFQGLILVVACLVFPAIGLIIRRQWMISIAREEEIKRLLILTSEEDSRAEVEAFSGYSPVPVSVKNKCVPALSGHSPVPISVKNKCVLCYSPTTTRCARCKSVRYCSGKCQIIHWRQGHKEECCPFTSESTVSSFSGFSSSGPSSESSDNVSTTESDGQTNPEIDGRLSADDSVDVDQSKPLSPKFASLVDSVESFSKLGKLNQLKPTDSERKSQTASLSTSGFSRKLEGSIAEPFKSFGFCGRKLHSGSRSDTYVETATPSFSETNNNFHYSQSSVCFSFSLSGSTPLHKQGSEGNGVKSDNALPVASGISRPTVGAAFAEKNCLDSSKIRTSQTTRCKANKNHTDNSSRHGSQEGRDTSSSLHVHPSSSFGGESACKSDSGIFASSNSGRPSQVDSDPGKTSKVLKSRDIECLSFGASDASSGSSTVRQSVQPMQSGRVDSMQASAAISSQSASSPNAISGLNTSVQKVVDHFMGSKQKHHCLGVGSEITRRCSHKELFPYELFVKLYNCNNVQLKPSGLINCGNSCYANVVLQCLACTPPLAAYFLQGLHSKTCVKEFCFTCEFERLLLLMKEGESPLSPFKIISQLRNTGSQLGNGREEDAHEFLRYAIDTMQSICLKEAGVTASGSLEEETSLIGLTFGGYLQSKIKCGRCQGKSERQERIMDLTIEIEGDIITLEEALRQFTITEILDGNNKYHCGRCKSYVRAKKKLTILEAPNVLTIALKRYQSGKFGKLNKPILFSEILDLAPFMSRTGDKLPIYRLFGVVVHLDIMNASFSGHYVCYVKNIQNKWFKIDDSTVTTVDIESVLTKGAYMLLYSRCSPRLPRLIRNRTITHDPKIKATPSPINKRNKSPSSQFDMKNSSDNSTSLDSFYSGFHRLQRILEEDAYGDNSSLFSSNSDEGSYSTDSTRDSLSADDFSDFLFGDSCCGCSSWQSPSDSDVSSSSSSPLYSTQSFADVDRNVPGYLEKAGFQYGGGSNLPFLHSNISNRNCREVASSICCSKTDSERLGYSPMNYVKSGVSIRKSMDERAY